MPPNIDMQTHNHMNESTHQGLRVFYSTFLFLHNTGRAAFKNIKMSCREDGLVPRVHGNTRRLPSNAQTFERTQCATVFNKQYAEDYAIMLPGQIPGYKWSDLQLLSCSMTKNSVWKCYIDAAALLPSSNAVAYSTFCLIWKTLLPNILPTRPMTDL